MKDTTEDQQVEDKVPGFSKWNFWYILVLSTLVVLIALFYLFTISFD